MKTKCLYNVKGYKSKAEFKQDKNKHFTDIKKFRSYKYGFMVKSAHRLGTPLPYPGRLKFFEVENPLIDSIMLKLDVILKNRNGKMFAPIPTKRYLDRDIILLSCLSIRISK